MSSTSNNSLVGGAIVKFDYDRTPQTEFYKVTTENQEEYIEKMKKVKIADYDNTAFLSNCLEFNKASNSTYMNKRLTAALALQSKLPVYCLEGCGAGQALYGTQNVAVSLSITDQNGGEILDEKRLPKQVVPRTLDWMMNQEPNAKLEHIVFVSHNTEKQSGYNDNTFGDDVVEVAYIFKDVNDEYYSILRNVIGGKKYNGYYKLFTVCRHTIVSFQDANGKIQKTVVSPNYYETNLSSSLEKDDCYKENVLKGATQKIFAPVKFKIGDEKKEYLSMLFYVKDNCNLTVQSLQSKILAVHTLMPTEEQIKADLRPFWVAKRLKYEDYFVTTEDVTLRNGKSYYWDIGECWVARKNGNPSKDELKNYVAKDNSWYWDNGPFLPGNDETKNNNGSFNKKHYLAYINDSSGDGVGVDKIPPNDLGIEYCGNSSDVTEHTTNKQTVNIQPYQIATKAYAVIIKSEKFQEAGDLQKGGYYINGMFSGKEGYAGFINAADTDATYGKDCFINGRGDIPPNNGVLYNPKDELFTAYFLVKGSVSENLVKKQYEILDTLKNGSREVSSAPQGESPEHKEIREEKEKESQEGTLQGRDYYPNYYKKFIDKNNEVIKKLNDAAEDLKKVYRTRVEEINNAIDAFENGRPATSEIGALERLGDLIGGGIQSEKLGESNKELFKSVNDTKIKLDTDEIKEKILYKCQDGNIISKISNDERDEDLEVIDNMKNPFKIIKFINHFSYTKKVIAFHDNGWLCEGQYALTYGWNQTRVAKLKPTIKYFKEIFKDINYDAYEDKHLLKDSGKDYPWWREVNSHIIFNESFVKKFFTEYDGDKDSADSYTFNKKITLKPIEYKIEDSDSKIRTVTITEKKINEIEEYFNKLNPGNESFDNGEFAKTYIDEKTEFIVDCFYNMIKNVYGTHDSEGVLRTKGYFVKDTPFELRTIKDESGNPIKMVGFDLRELIDACFEQLFVADEDAVRECVTRIGGVLKKRNWDISNEEDYKAFFEQLQPFFQNAVNETATRLNDEFDLEIAKRQAQMMKISQEAGIIYQRKFNTGVKISIGMALAGAVTAKVVKVIVQKAMKSVMQAAVKEVAKWAAKKAAKKALLFALSKALGVIPVIGWAITIVATLVEIGMFLYCYLRDSYLQAHLAYSDDYVYKFTCRAKKSERLYSMTKRGCIISDVIAEVGQPKLEGETEKTKGDYERVKSYYNWLAEPGEPIPTKGSLLEFNKKLFHYKLDGEANSISLLDKYDGRVAVIIPSTEETLSDEDVYSDYSESALENIENFIQTWMAKKEVAVESQAELPIEGYYDMLNGMHPYVEVGFRMGLGLCGRKKIDGNADVFYNEAGLPIIVKRGNNYYKVKHNLVSYKDKNGNSVESYDAGHTYDFSEGSSDLQAISEAEYIKLASRNFRRINSRDYPYFKSMTIKDNGVKKVTLNLIDPNFASYTTGIRSYYSAGGKATKNGNGDFVRLDVYDEDDYENKVFSLEQLIRGALRSPTFIKEERIERYSNETGNLKNDFLSIDESLVASPTNLKIRYGYDDFNPSGERFSDSRFVDVAKRDARWWNVRHLGNTNFNTVTHVKKYISDGDIENRGGKWTSVKEAKMTEDDGIKPSEGTTINVENSRGYDVDHYTLLKSNAQTVVMSKEIDFMITNFKSKLTSLGIEYTIEGIETKDANIIRTRFLQRYASINANPEEVLYILMHMFNEDNDGNNIKESRVKILLVSDDEDTQVPLMKDKLNMEFDLKKLKEGEYDATMADNIYEMAYQQEMLMVKEDLLKKINITLGGAAAVKNYGNGTAVNSYTPLYKTLAQLLNEFCSACPPKKKIEKRELVTDENGNDVLSNQASTNTRPLKWFSFEDTTHDTTYVCLYYRTVIKPPKIRVYTYGPMNPTISCVTDLSLENANEFAVLSAVRSFDGKKSKLTTRSSNIYAEREEQTNKEEQADKFKLGATWGGTDYVGLNAENYSQAFASCMYNGNMTILGDPFWSFDGLIQPCTYPIKLNVIMPQSEFTRQVDGGKGTADLRKQIEELRAQSNNREVEENYWYGETHERSLKKNIYKNSDPEHEDIVCVKPADTVRVHQVLHESSGYYVVKDITQTIDQGGFTTTLGIMSYPNIHKDVLLTPEEVKARSSAKS